MSGVLPGIPFVGKKHHPVMLVCDFRDKAYQSIYCEAKLLTSSPGMIFGRKGISG